MTASPNAILDVFKRKGGLPLGEDLEKRKQKWLASLETLLRQIDAWLAPALDAGMLKRLPHSGQQLEEELIGTYVAPNRKFQLATNSQFLHVRPRGTFIIGACARVDVEGPQGVGVLVLPGDFVSWYRVGESPQHLILLDEAVFAQILDAVLP